MRLLLPLLLLSSLSFGQYSGIKCEDVDGIEENYNEVPKDFTGMVFYCAEGMIAKSRNYKDGKRDGVERAWYENGQLEYERNYIDGKIDGVHRAWGQDGQLWKEENYKDGEFDGVQRLWYKNGQLRYEGNLVDAKGEGVQRRWHDNGQLEVEANCKDDKVIDDKIVYYNKDGTIKKTEYYEDGEVVRCEGDCD